MEILAEKAEKGKIYYVKNKRGEYSRYGFHPTGSRMKVKVMTEYSDSDEGQGVLVKDMRFGMRFDYPRDTTFVLVKEEGSVATSCEPVTPNEVPDREGQPKSV